MKSSSIVLFMRAAVRIGLVATATSLACAAMLSEAIAGMDWAVSYSTGVSTNCILRIQYNIRNLSSNSSEYNMSHVVISAGTNQGVYKVIMPVGWNVESNENTTVFYGRNIPPTGTIVSFKIDSTRTNICDGRLSANALGEDQTYSIPFKPLSVKVPTSLILPSEPSAQTAAVAEINKGANFVTLRYDSGEADHVLVVVNQDDFVPMDGKKEEGRGFVRNAHHESGLHSVTIAGLMPGTTYHFQLYAYNEDADGLPNYVAVNPAEIVSVTLPVDVDLCIDAGLSCLSNSSPHAHVAGLTVSVPYTAVWTLSNANTVWSVTNRFIATSEIMTNSIIPGGYYRVVGPDGTMPSFITGMRMHADRVYLSVSGLTPGRSYYPQIAHFLPSSEYLSLEGIGSVSSSSHEFSGLPRTGWSNVTFTISCPFLPAVTNTISGTYVHP